MSRAGILSLVLLPCAALAGSVYLNDVNIDGVVNQKFEKATVRIDEKGNVHITAPGYSATTVPLSQATPPPSAPTAKLSKKYWLVAEQNAPGMTGYEIDVFVNSKWIRKLKNDDPQNVIELTSHLVPGKNAVLFAAKKLATAAPKSLRQDYVYKVLVGEGDVGGDHVMLDGTLAKFEKSAADTGDVSREFTFTAR